MTRVSDALAAARMGVDYLGFIFAESPRGLTPEAARRITESVPAEVERVGVFVNEEEETIKRTFDTAGLTMVQLHGTERPSFANQIGLPLIKVLRTTNEGLFDLIPLYETEFILLEPYVPGKAGGTGKIADWELARRVVEAFPQKRFFLAGGLGPENVTAALQRVRPFAVDGNSGLEDTPGCKNEWKMREFVRIVRSLA
jgi:phosphoribosylanthranilate isomerase